MIAPRRPKRRWSWLAILATGILVFCLIFWTIRATRNVNYVPSLLMVGAFTVPVACCGWLYSRNQVPRVPPLSLGQCLLWGGLLGTLVAGNLEYETVRNLKVLPVVAIGIIEETAKLIVPFCIFVWWRLSLRRWRQHYGALDGIIIGAASGAGFAAFESMGYGLVALLESGGSLTVTVWVLSIRALMAPAAHIAWSGLLGGALWQAISAPRPRTAGGLIVTFIGVVALHALWDVSGTSWRFPLVGAISLLWLVVRVRRAGRDDVTPAPWTPPRPAI